MRSGEKLGLLMLLMAVGAVCHGQVPADIEGRPSLETIERWLGSGDAREAAWAAVYAAKQKETLALPELEQIAVAWRPLPHHNVRAADGQELPLLTADDQDRLDLMYAVLDAVIQMHGRLPRDAVKRLAQDFPAQAALLLARMNWNEAEPVLWALYADDKPASFAMPAVAAAMLAWHPPQHFVVSLLRNTTMHRDVKVRVAGDELLMSDSGGCSGGMIPGSIRQDWPATGRYSLEFGRSSANMPGNRTTWVVRGQWPISVMRSLEPTRTAAQLSREHCDGPILTDEVRMTLLAEMLGIPEQQMIVKAWDPTTLTVSNMEDWHAQLRSYVDGQEARLGALTLQLRQKNLLSADEAGEEGARPKLALFLDDQRSKKEFDLERPQLPYANVRWAESAAF